MEPRHDEYWPCSPAQAGVQLRGRSPGASPSPGHDGLVPYGLLADAVVALHAGFILFALLGDGLLVRFPKLVWLHLPALAWGSWIAATGNICPLTPLENRYRELAGQGDYGGGFVDHYLTPVIYPEGLTRGTQAIYGGVLVVVNLVLYWRWLSARSVGKST